MVELINVLDLENKVAALAGIEFLDKLKPILQELSKMSVASYSKFLEKAVGDLLRGMTAELVYFKFGMRLRDLKEQDKNFKRKELKMKELLKPGYVVKLRRN